MRGPLTRAATCWSITVKALMDKKKERKREEGRADPQTGTEARNLGRKK